MNTDSDLECILQDIPHIPKSIPGSGYFKVPPANCYVCKREEDGITRLEIYPITGGWLGVDKKNLLADIAPFCG